MVKEKTFTYQKITINYLLQIQKRKTISIKIIDNNNLLIKSPPYVTHYKIEVLLKEKFNWILKQLELQKKRKLNDYKQNGNFFYLGTQYKINIILTDKNYVELKDKYLIVFTNSMKEQHIKKLIDIWKKESAYKIFVPIFEEIWTLFSQGKYIKPTLVIKKFKRRWGSLSTTNNLSLNIDLIKAPMDCIYYVVIHEFCHLIHFNHSKEYYQELSNLIPNWKYYKEILKYYS